MASFLSSRKVAEPASEPDLRASVLTAAREPVVVLVTSRLVDAAPDKLNRVLRGCALRFRPEENAQLEAAFGDVSGNVEGAFHAAVSRNLRAVVCVTAAEQQLLRARVPAVRNLITMRAPMPSSGYGARMVNSMVSGQHDTCP